MSRLFQYVSDGTLGYVEDDGIMVRSPVRYQTYSLVAFAKKRYNQARKIAYIPFPFAHAQITCLFVLVIVAFIPVLMLTYLTNEWFGFVLNMLTGKFYLLVDWKSIVQTSGTFPGIELNLFLLY